MEGGLLIHAAWALSFVFVWVYRRWFEKTGPRLPEFEAFCAERPLLAALSVRRGGEEAALRALRALLPRNETIATFGAWPWVHHVLSVECSARPGVVYASITGCRVLRTAEARPPSLTQGLVAERRLFQLLASTEDKAEGMAAFVEKRPAVWKGR